MDLTWVNVNSTRDNDLFVVPTRTACRMYSKVDTCLRDFDVPEREFEYRLRESRFHHVENRRNPTRSRSRPNVA